MSYEFTRLPEVEVLENLTENAHLIVEDGGKTRRFPASEFSGGDTVLGEDGKLVESVLPDGYPYDFGTEIVEEFFVEETTHNFDDTWWQPEDFVFELKPNATHIVTWDGTEYECTVMKEEGTIYTVLGNGAFASGNYYEDTGEPFCFVNAYGDSHIAVSESALGSHTFSVKTRTVKKNCRKIGADFLPDGYPYSEIKNVAILPEQTVEVENGDGSYEYIDVYSNFDIVDGNIYKVIFNGQEYNCTAWYFEDWDAVILGNALYLGESDFAGDDVPFAFETYTGNSQFYFYADGGTHTISVSGDAEVITKIDTKYLPALILKSPNGTRYQITVSDSGELSASALA
jgi:hypothetical protein